MKSSVMQDIRTDIIKVIKLILKIAKDLVHLFCVHKENIYSMHKL